MNVDAFFARWRDPARAAVPALEAAGTTLDYAGLDRAVQAHAARLAGTRVVASLMDNGGDWIVHDLACLRAGVVHLPLPLFFTLEQLDQALARAGADALACDAAFAARVDVLGFHPAHALAGGVTLYRRPAPAVAMPAGTAKITFTSGSTGQPKGVCLDATGMLAVAEGLASATRPLGIARHLNALPLPVLLENIAGVYAPLIAGATIVARPLRDVGMQGSSRFDPAVFHAALSASGAHSVIVLPEMLRALVGWLGAAGQRAPQTLRLVAAGGAPVASGLLATARALGVPAHEGYGLSEASSVQTLNLPGADRPGSVGRPLPHARVRVAADGEIEVAGSLALGYLGEPALTSSWLPTGDLGHVDDDGFLHVRGRRKNVLITGYGRNVSPEWIETRLGGEPAIGRAVVFGDGQPTLGAVIWPLGDATDDQIAAGIARVNAGLPDYARIGPWMRAQAAYSATTGMATANGRPRRADIAARHPDLFSDTSHSVPTVR